MSLEYLQERFGSKLKGDEIIRAADYYYDFTNNAFNVIFNDMYANHPIVNCILEITAINTDGVYGECTKGIVIIHLFEILRMVPRRAIYTFIISVVAHELMHLNQYMPVKHNFTKEEVLKFIEKPNDWETIQYLTEKREYLEDTLGVNFNMLAYKLIDLSYAIYETDVYRQMTEKEYWIYLICRLYVDKDSVKDFEAHLSKSIDDYPSVNIFVFTDVENDKYYSFRHPIKINNKYIMPDDELLTLIYNINKLSSCRFSCEVITKNFKDDGSYESLDVKFKYTEVLNKPLIKYDNKPCAD